MTPRRDPFEMPPGYALVRVLDTGSQHHLVLAAPAGGGPQVALRLFHAGRFPTPAALAGYRDRAARLLALDHPHLVRSAPAEHGGRVYAVEEVALPSLADRGPLPAPQAARLVRDAALGVGAAHRAGVLHLNLKPRALPLDPAGTLKVAGFDRGRLLGEPSAPGDTVSGTARFMAHEQFTARPVGPPTDVFALGVVLYELLTRQTPFPGEGLADMMLRVSAADPPPPSAHLPVPGGLEAVVLRSLARDPAARHADGGALAAALDRWLDDAGERR